MQRLHYDGKEMTPFSNCFWSLKVWKSFKMLLDIVMRKTTLSVFRGLLDARRLPYHLFHPYTLKGSGDNCWETVTFVFSNNWSGYVKFAALEAIAGKHPEHK